MREFRGGRQVGKRDGAEAAHFERADIAGSVGVVLLSAVGAGALSLGVHNIERLAIGRERDSRRIPANRNVFDDLHGSRVENADSINAGFGNVDAAGMEGKSAGHDAAQGATLGVLKTRTRKER